MEQAVLAKEAKPKANEDIPTILQRFIVEGDDYARILPLNMCTNNKGSPDHVKARVI